MRQHGALLGLARDHYRPVAGEDGHSYAVPSGGPALAYPVRATGRDGLRPQLARLFFDTYGRAPTGRELTAVLSTLALEAQDTAPTPVAYRVARLDDGRAVLDLGRPDGRCVVIEPGAWHVANTSPVLFRRSPLTGRLPVPERGGCLDELRQIVNLDPEGWRLVLAWLVAALLGDVACPVLALTGGALVGKSTAARLLVSLVDPSPAPLRRPPRDMRAWGTTAAASWVVALDGAPPLSPWLADLIAHTVDGAGVVRRAPNTTGEVTVTALRRPLLVTARSLGPVTSDLARRLVVVQLAPIPPQRRQEEGRMWAAYERGHSHHLGGLFDLTARVLDELREPLDPWSPLDPGASRSRPPASGPEQGSRGLAPPCETSDTPTDRGSAAEPLAPRPPDFAHVLAAVDRACADGSR